MNKTNFQKGMAILQLAFPGFIEEKTKAGTLDIYWKFIKHIPDPEFEISVSRHIQNKKTFPSIADLLESSRENKEVLALNAWTGVLKEISREGSWGTPKFKDPDTKRAVESIGGWKFICSCETDQMSFQRTAFLKAFKAFEDNDNDQENLLSTVDHKILGLVGMISDGKNTDKEA